MGRNKKDAKTSNAAKTAAKSDSVAEQPEQQAEAFVTREVDEPNPSKAERISLKLKDDGLVDWESHRGDTKEKIIKAFANDPEALKLIGLQSPLLPDGQGITEENARVALAVIAQIDGFVAGFLLKQFAKMPLDPQVQARAFTFTEPQMKEMAPRAARVANKYSTAAVLKYQDELALAGMFVAYVGEQAKTAIVMQAMVNQRKAQEAASIQGPVETTKPVNGHDATPAVPDAA
jgi:hypothetical protein